MKIRAAAVNLTLGLLFVPGWCSPASGDGGTVRLLERKGPYEIAVFSAPTPFRAGPVDLSVLVQDVATGEPVPDLRVAITLAPRGRPGEAVRHPATTEAATNKLLHAAVFELPEAGWWQVEVAIEGSMGIAQARFALEAAKPSPQWPALWPWLSWPALAITLFALHQVLVRRRSRTAAGISGTVFTRS